MKKITARITAAALCTAFCAGGAGIAYAQTAGRGEQVQVKQSPVTVTESKDSSVAVKDETVYVLAGTDGSVKKIIVSDRLNNTLGENSLSDISELTDIENVRGDEAFVQGNDGDTLWDAKGNDIYYRGITDKELPVGLSVTYELDGKAMTAEEMTGKSGKVTIRFEYENRQYETVKINGCDEKIYVPFAVITGMLLDNDSFRNIEATNGKLVNDGDRTAVIGFALPGMQEDLGIDKDVLEIPDHIEITADVTDFHFGMTVTVATNEVFDKLSEIKLDSADDITSSVKELTDGMKQLIDGSSAMYDGLSELLEKSGELADGVTQLADGAKKLSDGTASLDSGAAQLDSGASELSAGLNTLKGSNAELNGGAKQVFDTLLSTAETQIKSAGVEVEHLTTDNYADVLNGVISSLDKTSVYNQALAQVTAAVESNRPLITEKVTAAVRSQVEAQVTAAAKEKALSGVTAAVTEQVAAKVIEQAAGMSKAEYDAAVTAGMIPKETQSAIESAVKAQLGTDDVKALIVNNTAEQMESEAVKTAVKQNTDAQMQTAAVKKTVTENVNNQVKQVISENMASAEVQGKLAAASEGAKSIISLKASLDGYNAFYLGLLTYTDGVSAAADGAVKLTEGAKSLKDGAAHLKSGAKTLNDGTAKLKDSLPALTSGVTQLKDGAKKLSDGLNEFNEKGIEKIAKLVNEDAEGIAERIKAMADVSENYRSYSGISDSMDGQVRFIYRTDETE